MKKDKKKRKVDDWWNFQTNEKVTRMKLRDGKEYRMLNKDEKYMQTSKRWMAEQKVCLDGNTIEYIHSRYAFKDKKIKRKICTSTRWVKFKKRTLIIDKEKILQKWNKYIGEFFNDNKGVKPTIYKNMERPVVLK